MFNLFKKKDSKYEKGDLLIYNQNKEFGDENDRLFQIKDKRYGTCINNPKKQWWYFGHLLEIRDVKGSKGLTQIPFYRTSLFNAPEDSLKGLESLIEKE